MDRQSVLEEQKEKKREIKTSELHTLRGTLRARHHFQEHFSSNKI